MDAKEIKDKFLTSAQKTVEEFIIYIEEQENKIKELEKIFLKKNEYIKKLEKQLENKRNVEDELQRNKLTISELKRKVACLEKQNLKVSETNNNARMVAIKDTETLNLLKKYFIEDKKKATELIDNIIKNKINIEDTLGVLQGFNLIFIATFLGKDSQIISKFSSLANILSDESTDKTIYHLYKQAVNDRQEVVILELDSYLDNKGFTYLDKNLQVIIKKIIKTKINDLLIENIKTLYPIDIKKSNLEVENKNNINVKSNTQIISSQRIVENFNEIELNDASVLAKLGYSTTISRAARRDILLNKAIPQLGKKRTQYIINRFINYNGKSERQRRALMEWRHDLDMLNRI